MLTVAFKAKDLGLIPCIVVVDLDRCSTSVADRCVRVCCTSP